MGEVVLCIPTLNAGGVAVEQIAALNSQSLRPDAFLVIDSSSTDDTAENYREAGADVLVIPQRSFDHGGTRNIALTRYPDADALVFMTQDAVPADRNSLSRLVSYLNDSEVGAAHGRQIPRIGSGSIEAHARLFNYPSAGHVRSHKDIAAHGIKSVFLSNSFAVYRRRALESVGGFPQGSVMNEDMYAAGKLLLTGWKLAYAADAMVRHSHAYTTAQEFRRYFDIGVFMARNPWLTKAVGSPGAEGWRYVRSELGYLLENDPFRIPAALSHSVAKLTGMRLGRREARLPLRLKRRLGMNRSFWDSAAPDSVSRNTMLDSRECRSPKV